MSRRKWAWDAYHMVKTDEEKWKAAEAIEMAVVEDFTDELYEKLEAIDDMLDQAPNVDIKLGVILARNAIRETLDNRYRL